MKIPQIPIRCLNFFILQALASASGINMNSDPDFHENERLQESVTSIDNNEQIRLLLAGTICMLPFAYGPGKQRLYRTEVFALTVFRRCNPCRDYCRWFK